MRRVGSGYGKSLQEEMSRRQLSMEKYGVHRNCELWTEKRSTDCVLGHSNIKGQVTTRGGLVEKVTSEAEEKQKKVGQISVSNSAQMPVRSEN